MIEKIDILNALDKLQFNLKTVIILKYYNDLTFDQIAIVLACPTSTIKSRYYNALNQLKIILENK